MSSLLGIICHADAFLNANKTLSCKKFSLSSRKNHGDVPMGREMGNGPRGRSMMNITQLRRRRGRRAHMFHIWWSGRVAIRLTFTSCYAPAASKESEEDKENIVNASWVTELGSRIANTCWIEVAKVRRKSPQAQ